MWSPCQEHSYAISATCSAGTRSWRVTSHVVVVGTQKAAHAPMPAAAPPAAGGPTGGSGAPCTASSTPRVRSASRCRSSSSPTLMPLSPRCHRCAGEAGSGGMEGAPSPALLTPPQARPAAVRGAGPGASVPAHHRGGAHPGAIPRHACRLRQGGGRAGGGGGGGMRAAAMQGCPNSAGPHSHVRSLIYMPSPIKVM